MQDGVAPIVLDYGGWVALGSVVSTLLLLMFRGLLVPKPIIEAYYGGRTRELEKTVDDLKDSNRANEARADLLADNMAKMLEALELNNEVVEAIQITLRRQQES